jgi:hypothetical protein
VEQGAAAGGGDVEGGDGDWEWSARAGGCWTRHRTRRTARLVAQIQGVPSCGRAVDLAHASESCRGGRRRARIRSRRAWRAGAVACLARAREAVGGAVLLLCRLWIVEERRQWGERARARARELVGARRRGPSTVYGIQAGWVAKAKPRQGKVQAIGDAGGRISSREEDGTEAMYVSIIVARRSETGRRESERTK